MTAPSRFGCVRLPPTLAPSTQPLISGLARLQASPVPSRRRQGPQRCGCFSSTRPNELLQWGPRDQDAHGCTPLPCSERSPHVPASRQDLQEASRLPTSRTEQGRPKAPSTTRTAEIASSVFCPLCAERQKRRRKTVAGFPVEPVPEISPDLGALGGIADRRRATSVERPIARASGPTTQIAKPSA
jgi:hypothetical protein